MRPLAELTAAAALILLVTSASGAPLRAPSYFVEIAEKPGAIFGALSRDGDTIIVTDLAQGRLLRRGPNGGFVATGPTLPHGLDVFGEPTGPYKALPLGRDLLVAQSTTPVHQDEGPNDHALIEVDDTRVVKVVSSDFWNPFGLISDGAALFVIDASRNDVERLALDGSGKTTLFTFPRLKAPSSALQHLSPTEFGKTPSYEYNAVPTGIAAHDGRLYVTLFAGFPYLPGAGRVVSLSASEPETSARIEAVDLNAPIDVAFDGDGRMLVLEHGTYNPSTNWDLASGRLLRIDRTTGERQVVVEGLTRPVGILLLDGGQVVLSQLDGKLVFLKPKPP
jgi:hypothetical protein